MTASSSRHLLNRVFGNVYVISLRDCLDRRQQVQSLFSALGIEYNFIDATDGRGGVFSSAQWDQKAAIGNRFMPSSRILRSSEVGCALSHLECYRRVIEENHASAVIFEDDIDVTGSTFECLGDLPEDFELAYLGVKNRHDPAPLAFRVKRAIYYPILRRFFPEAKASRWSDEELGVLYPQRHSGIWHKAGIHHGFHAYAVSHAGAKKLLDYNYPVRLPADLVANELIIGGSLRAYLPANQLFVQRSDRYSTLGNPV